MANPKEVLKLYKSVMDDVINNVREAFLDEGVDEQVLQELRQIWENKLMLTRAVDPTPQPIPQVEASRSQKSHSSRGASSAPNIDAQLQMRAAAGVQQRTGAMAVGGAVAQGAQAFHLSGTNTQLVSTRLNLCGMSYELTSGAVCFETALEVLKLREAFQSEWLVQSASLQEVVIHITDRQNITSLSLLDLLSSSAAAATLAFQQGMLTLPQQLTSLPAGLSLAQSDVTQTFPAYTFNQAQHTTLPPGSYQAVLPTGQTVVIQPTPQQITTQLQQQRQQQQQQQQQQQGSSAVNLGTVQARVLQVDGANDTSDEEEDDDDEEDNENEDDENDENEEYNKVEEEPLNSDDDVSDEDPAELFETENVVVCQYDKINRSRNRWKFHLKNGIMNLKGRDYVFYKASGDSEW